MKGAVLSLNRQAPDHDITDVPGFITRWVQRFEETGTVLPSNPITHPAIPRATAEQCVEILLRGYTEKVVIDGVEVERQYAFRSIRAAVKRNEFLRNVLTDFGVTECTLLRALHHVDPTLRRRHIIRKYDIPEHVKHQRVQQCQAWLHLRPARLHRLLMRTFWIDSKIFYLTPGGEWVYWPPGVDITVVDPRMGRSRYDVKKLVYYAVVNAVFGAVHIKFVTGSADRKRDPDYKVYMVSFPPFMHYML